MIMKNEKDEDVSIQQVIKIMKNSLGLRFRRFKKIPI